MPVQPDARNLHISAPLTNISTAYVQGEDTFFAAQVFPQVPVARQGDLYYTYNKGDWFRSLAGVRAPATESPGGGWDVANQPYYAPVYAIHKDLDSQTRANADRAFDLDRDATRWVTQQLLIKRDRLFVDSYLKTGVWGTTITGVAATPGANQVLRWDVAGSTPIEDVAKHSLAITRTTGMRPNVLVLGPDVWNALRNHASILERIKYTQRGIVAEDLIASLFGVGRLVVTWTVENTAPVGATDSFAFQNSKTALLCYANPSPGLMTPSAGYIFTWTGLLGAGAMGTRIRRFPMPLIDSDRVEGEMAFDMKIVGADLGVFFDGIVT